MAITDFDLESAGGGGGVNTLYSADDTVKAGRVATLTDTLTFAGANTNQVNFGVGTYIKTTEVGYTSYAIYVGQGTVACQLNGAFQILSYNSSLKRNYISLYGGHYLQSTSAGLWTLSDTTAPTYNIGARFGIETLGSTNATIALKVQNSASIDTFTLNDASEGKILNNVASPLSALTLENEASGSTHALCGVKLQLTSNADTGHIAQYDSTSGGSNAPTMEISSPTGINYIAGASFGSGYHYFQTGGGGAVGFDRDGNNGIVNFMTNGGGGTNTEVRLAVTGTNFNYINSPANVSTKSFAWGRSSAGTAIELMRITRDGQLGVNSDGVTIDASAILDLTSTDKGFLPPRMTTTEMNAIGTPASGLMVFDRTTSQWMGYNGTSWVILG